MCLGSAAGAPGEGRQHLAQGQGGQEGWKPLWQNAPALIPQSAAKMKCKMAHIACMSPLSGRERLLSLKGQYAKAARFLALLSLLLSFQAG